MVGTKLFGFLRVLHALAAGLLITADGDCPGWKYRNIHVAFFGGELSVRSTHSSYQILD